MTAKQSLSFESGMTSSQTCDLPSRGKFCHLLWHRSFSGPWVSIDICLVTFLLVVPQQVYSCLYWRFGVHITRKQMNQNLTFYLVLCESFHQPHCVAKGPGNYSTTFGFHLSGLPSLLLSAFPSWHHLPHSGQGNISVPCPLGTSWLASQTEKFSWIFAK